MGNDAGISTLDIRTDTTVVLAHVRDIYEYWETPRAARVLSPAEMKKRYRITHQQWQVLWNEYYRWKKNKELLAAENGEADLYDPNEFDAELYINSQWRDIIDGMVERAKKGDVKAAMFCAELKGARVDKRKKPKEEEDKPLSADVQSKIEEMVRLKRDSITARREDTASG